jgi:hypothetical protein
MKRDKLWFSAVVEKTRIDSTGIEEGDLTSLFKVCFAKFHQNEYS